MDSLRPGEQGGHLAEAYQPGSLRHQEAEVSEQQSQEPRIAGLLSFHPGNAGNFSLGWEAFQVV